MNFPGTNKKKFDESWFFLFFVVVEKSVSKQSIESIFQWFWQFFFWIYEKSAKIFPKSNLNVFFSEFFFLQTCPIIFTWVSLKIDICKMKKTTKKQNRNRMLKHVLHITIKNHHHHQQQQQFPFRKLKKKHYFICEFLGYEFLFRLFLSLFLWNKPWSDLKTKQNIKLRFVDCMIFSVCVCVWIKNLNSKKKQRKTLN